MSEAIQFRKICPSDEELGIMYIGQAGFLFTTGQGVLCIDPYLSNCVEKLVGPEARRMWWNKFSVETLRPDALLITHDHLDHLDPETLPVFEQVSPPQAYFGPDTVLTHLRELNFREDALKFLQRGDCVSWGGMDISAVYAEHTEDSIGAVIRTGGISVYITGDTCLTDELVNGETMDCDILIACINGIDENLNPEEAMELASRLHAKLVIPMHYGLLPCSTVSQLRFDQAVLRAGIKGVTLPVETTWILKKSESGVEAVRK